LNNHQQDILSNGQMTTESVSPSNSQLTIATNTHPPPITTNNFNETIKLSKLELLNQPARLRKHRNLEELRGKGCPTVRVEGAGQRASLQFKVNSGYFSNHFSI